MSCPQSFFGYFPFRINRIQLKQILITINTNITEELKDREYRIHYGYWVTDPNKFPSQNDLCTTRVFGIISFFDTIIWLSQTHHKRTFFCLLRKRIIYKNQYKQCQHYQLFLTQHDTNIGTIYQYVSST